MSRALLVFTLLLQCLIPGASAGSSSGGAANFTAVEIATLAKNVERALAAEGARVAIISRVGRSPETLPQGIEYTHVAFAVYSQITAADGSKLPGYAIYNLYQDADQRDRSALVQDFPIDYFAATHALRSGVIVLVPDLQQRLLETIFSERYARVHNPSYSVFSNPFDPRYQNCTEFVLDVLQAAIYETADVARIKANNRAYFEPQRIQIDGLRLFLAQLFADDVRVDDHDGEIRTATFASIAGYLQRNGLVSRILTVDAGP